MVNRPRPSWARGHPGNLGSLLAIHERKKHFHRLHVCWRRPSYPSGRRTFIVTILADDSNHGILLTVLACRVPRTGWNQD